MKASELKPGEAVMLSRDDFEDMKRQAFKHALTCLAESIAEAFPDGDEVAVKLNALVQDLINAQVAKTAN